MSMCFAMRITRHQLECLTEAAEILREVHSWSRESEDELANLDLESMAGAGVLLVTAVALKLRDSVPEDTVSEFKTPYPGVSTRWVIDSTEGQSKARSFGDEGP